MARRESRISHQDVERARAHVDSLRNMSHELTIDHHLERFGVQELETADSGRTDSAVVHVEALKDLWERCDQRQAVHVTDNDVGHAITRVGIRRHHHASACESAIAHTDEHHGLLARNSTVCAHSNRALCEFGQGSHYA
jgi:hypothetical protein